MSLRPDIQKRDPENQFSLGDITFSNPTLLLANFHLGLNEAKNRYDASVLQDGKDTLQLGSFNYMDLLKDDPTLTPEQITAMQEERPGLFIPQNTKAKIGEVLQKRYDDNMLYNFVSNHPQPGILGTLSAYGGAIGASLLDPATLVGGGVGAKVATKFITPTATNYMSKLAVKGVMGSQAARVATKVAQNSITGAGFGAGSQTLIEAGEQNILRQEGKPSEYIQSAQRIGHAIGLGALIGAGFTPVEMAASSAFDRLNPKAKEVIGRYYTPWSKNADITAREDSVGQVYNGVPPDATNTLRQGAIDAGSELRERLKENGVDIAELDEHLINSNDHLDGQIRDLVETRRNIAEADKALEARFEKAINENQELSQAGIVKTLEQSQFDTKILEKSGMTIPENLQKFIDVQNDIKRLKEKLAQEQKRRPSEVVIKPELGAQDVTREQSEPNKKVLRRIEQLEKRQPKILTPKEELSFIKKRLLGKNGLPNGFEQSTDFRRLQDLAKVWRAGNDLLDRVYLEDAQNKQINALANQKIFVASLRSQINDTHVPLTRDDMINYGEHLKSIGVDPIDFELPGEEPTSISEQLKEYDEPRVKDLLERTKIDEIKNEYEATRKKIDNQPSFSKMVKDMVNCILRGA